MRYVISTTLAWLLGSAQGWNSDGHRIVSRIASEFMAYKTVRFLREHLLEGRPAHRMKVGKALENASVWADYIVDKLPWSAQLHFVNTPYRDCSSFDPARHCGEEGDGRCIVTAIANYTMRASDISLNIDERVQAIKFLSHFVADAHQPLHGGFAKDRGATRLKLGSPTDSLHEVWDSHLIEILKQSMAIKGDKAWFNSANNLVSVLKADNPLRLSIGIPSFSSYPSESEILDAASLMMSETISQHTCASAYKDDVTGWIVKGQTLSLDYMASRKDVVKTQLMKAGIRLAQIMDAVANNYFLLKHRKAYEAGAMESSKFDAMNIFDVIETDFELDTEEEVDELPVLSDGEEADPESLEEAADSTEPEPSKSSTRTSEEKKSENNRKKRNRKKGNKSKLRRS